MKKLRNTLLNELITQNGYMKRASKDFFSLGPYFFLHFQQ